MSEILNDWMRAKLNARIEQDNLRTLPAPQSGIDFYSNDYRGWSTGGKIDSVLASKDVSEIKGLSGSTGSRLISGNSPLAESIEKRIAEIHRAEAALLFGSGYMANLGVIGALTDRHTCIVMDEYCHASMMDAAHGSIHKKILKFRHNDIVDLEAKLKLCSGKILVLTESVYSMDGDVLPFEHVAKICLNYSAMLIVDEAHAIGVCGDNGIGLAYKFPGLSLVRIYTYGKAMACHGAAVAGTRLLIDFLINFSRPFIYSTAPPAHQVLAISAAYDLLEDDNDSLKKLRSNISIFNSFVQEYHVKDIVATGSAIQLWMIRGNEQAKRASRFLLDSGINAKHILSPTVAGGDERIRICLHAFNSKDELMLLFEKMKEFQELN